MASKKQVQGKRAEFVEPLSGKKFDTAEKAHEFGVVVKAKQEKMKVQDRLRAERFERWRKEVKNASSFLTTLQKSVESWVEECDLWCTPKKAQEPVWRGGKITTWRMLPGGRLGVEATFELFSLSARYVEVQHEFTADDLLGEEDAESFDESAPDLDMGVWGLCDDWASQVDEQSGRRFETWRLSVELPVKDYPALYACVLTDVDAVRTEIDRRETVAERIRSAQQEDAVLQGVRSELALVRAQLQELEKREAARKSVVAVECLEQPKEHVAGGWVDRALTCLSEADFNGCVSNPRMLPILESFEELKD